MPTEQHRVPASTDARGASKTIVTVGERAALSRIEATGGALGNFVDARALEGLVRKVDGDLRAIARADPRAGVGIRGHSHRLFDVGWMRRGRFELIGVVARPDRIPLTPGFCGETHLLYRLAYATEVSGEAVGSRLPMTIAVLLRGEPAQQTDCRAALQRWRVPEASVGVALADRLLSRAGPLRPEALGRDRLLEVRLNLQTVRWPSTVRPDLGGHAEYLLRAFRPDDQGALHPYRLENTPDIDRLRRSPGLRAELLAWLGEPEQLQAIDDGNLILPARFSASASVSVTPRGLTRLMNRPYAQLFRPKELEGLPLGERRLVRSPEALLRRLDDLTCAGCHQSRSIAGFHLLGDDGPDVAPGNALAVSSSPVLVEEEERRAAIIEHVVAGRKATFHRPPAERDPNRPGVWGARCGLGDPGFADWTCADGYRCAPFDGASDDRTVGVCIPASGGEVGDACEIGPMRPSKDPHRDRIVNVEQRPCAVGVCNTNLVGFPGGMCTTSCAEPTAHGTCGLIADLRPFNDCLARQTPFPRCLAEHVFEAGMRACDRATPCRDDYICARTPSGAGACIPPYFLFQMRVDGHP